MNAKQLLQKRRRARRPNSTPATISGEELYRRWGQGPALDRDAWKRDVEAARNAADDESGDEYVVEHPEAHPRPVK